MDRRKVNETKMVAMFDAEETNKNCERDDDSKRLNFILQNQSFGKFRQSEVHRYFWAYKIFHSLF